ncbi:LLM class F420-dependent oxidoreductase [Nocardioides dongxiaopingii]|uniref:LLM class F420-dependent oxidoreductase n=1 Tax=Nocardioides dongxiaopingii TaxID=2576036 RepID=UPI0010C763DD|nr:LLM class F420-dependent oxidoreductase [Nocardioides dongxiaopingii]
MATSTRWGMTIPLDGVPLAEQGDVCRELEDLGYTDLWSAEGMGTDGFTPLAVAAAVTRDVHLGIAIASAFTRGPALLAQTAATLAATAPERFTLGIGASSSVLVHEWNDLAFDRPLSRCRDLVRYLRVALTGERVDRAYDTFTVRGARVGVAVEQPPAILLAGLRGRMLELAGAEADGAILNWLSATDVARVAPIVTGAAGDDRPREVVARILVVPTDDAEVARAIGRRMITAYLNVPVYRAFHEWLGRSEELAPMWTAWAAGERREALAAIPDHVVDALVLHGSPEQVREGMLEHVAHGVTVPVAALLPVPGVDPLQACRDLAPR